VSLFTDWLLFLTLIKTAAENMIIPVNKHVS